MPGSVGNDPFIDRVFGGRYRVVRRLAHGGFGAVYQAVHEGTEQEVALKILPLSGQGRYDGSLDRFMREARVTASLSHPNTIRVFDVGGGAEGEEPPWLAMELIRGPTLEEVLVSLARRGRTMSEQQAIDLTLPVTGSLAEAHAVDLVHRDMKPSNIMLSPVPGNPPVIKLLDFGCTHVRGSDMTAAGAVFGTPGYMSPEQIEGTELDGRSDLFALGIVLHRCVTGRTPFEDIQPMPLMYRYAHVDVPDPRRVFPAMSDPFADLLLALLARGCAGRPAGAAVLRDRLLAIRPHCNVLAFSDRPERLAGDMATSLHSSRMSPVGLAALVDLVEDEGGHRIAALPTISQEAQAADDLGTMAYHNPNAGQLTEDYDAPPVHEASTPAPDQAVGRRPTKLSHSSPLPPPAGGRDPMNELPDPRFAVDQPPVEAQPDPRPDPTRVKQALTAGQESRPEPATKQTSFTTRWPLWLAIVAVVALLVWWQRGQGHAPSPPADPATVTHPAATPAPTTAPNTPGAADAKSAAAPVVADGGSAKADGGAGADAGATPGADSGSSPTAAAADATGKSARRSPKPRPKPVIKKGPTGKPRPKPKTGKADAGSEPAKPPRLKPMVFDE